VAQVLAERHLASGHVAWVAMSEVIDGDMAIGNLSTRKKSIQEASQSLMERNAGLTIPSSQHWSFLTQVHGERSIQVEANEAITGLEGDALVTTQVGKVLTIQVADCVPISLISENGAIAVVHAGWRGLINGVIESASQELERKASGNQVAIIGPHIGSCCYEFGRQDLEQFVKLFGSLVIGNTNSSSPSLNLLTIVQLILRKKSIGLIHVDNSCTSCDPKFWSYRANRTQKRQCLFAWLEKN
tara:strand:- start:1575 stop:2303 length:729 start_codon:yes stop_codon:yes gene_type:complete